MSTTWILKTDGRPLEVVQVFLKGLLEQAQLHGYVIPLYQSDGFSIAPSLVENPDQLVEADPFAPFVEANAAITVVHVDQTRKGERFGTVLRSCEIRAMRSYIQKGLVHPERWLVIGVDCLSSFPAADHDWRVQKAGSIKQLTYDALRFARQGGIAQYRYRGDARCVYPQIHPRRISASMFSAFLFTSMYWSRFEMILFRIFTWKGSPMVWPHKQW
jgi:formate dehydrogenase (coenzyme F420) beta subunit